MTSSSTPFRRLLVWPQAADETSALADPSTVAPVPQLSHGILAATQAARTGGRGAGASTTPAPAVATPPVPHPAVTPQSSPAFYLGWGLNE